MYDIFKEYPLTELNYETPFQCLVAVMLSAQTTDKQVNKVTKTFFEVVRSPQDVIDIWADAVWAYIRTVWLWKSKQKNLMKTAHILVEMTSIMEQKNASQLMETTWFSKDTGSWTVLEKDSVGNDKDMNEKQLLEHSLRANDWWEILAKRWYWIPDTIDSMIELAWVWEKTAKVVLYVLYGQPWVAVDTHVHRVMNRLWIVSTKTPLQTSKKIEVLIPDNYKDIAHRSIIYFGRYLCKAKKPECERCPFVKICHFYPSRIESRWLKWKKTKK